MTKQALSRMPGLGVSAVSPGDLLALHPKTYLFLSLEDSEFLNPTNRVDVSESDLALVVHAPVGMMSEYVQGYCYVLCGMRLGWLPAYAIERIIRSDKVVYVDREGWWGRCLPNVGSAAMQPGRLSTSTDS